MDLKKLSRISDSSQSLVPKNSVELRRLIDERIAAQGP